MNIIYKRRATKVIDDVVDWVESQNTPGSGARWFEKLDKEIISIASTKAKFALCKHESLAKFKYSCYTYNDWVIAFKVTKNQFEVCRFIWGAQLA